MASKTPTDKKTMDVSKPGESVPDISARPVLVTRRPMVQDPMVKDDKKPEEEPVIESEQPKEELTVRGGKVIKPLSEQKEADSSNESDEKEETAAEGEEKTDPEPAKPEKTEEEKTQAEEAAVVDAVADQAELKGKKKEGELNPDEKAKQEALQKLITDKKYFVPVGQVSRRRNRRTLLVFVVFLLLLAGTYLAFDAEVIKTNVTLPVDLIKT